MLPRHLTLERYELALEEDSPEAARLRAQVPASPTCTAALAETPLASVLGAWVLPASVDRFGGTACQTMETGPDVQ